jgi:hypothetical protein
MYWKDNRLKIREGSLKEGQPYLHLDSRYKASPTFIWIPGIRPALPSSVFQV